MKKSTAPKFTRAAFKKWARGLRPSAKFHYNDPHRCVVCHFLKATRGWPLGSFYALCNTVKRGTQTHRIPGWLATPLLDLSTKRAGYVITKKDLLAL